MIRRALTLPVLLAVTLIVAGCPRGGDGEAATETETAESPEVTRLRTVVAEALARGLAAEEARRPDEALPAYREAKAALAELRTAAGDDGWSAAIEELAHEDALDPFGTTATFIAADPEPWTDDKVAALLDALTATETDLVKIEGEWVTREAAIAKGWVPFEGEWLDDETRVARKIVRFRKGWASADQIAETLGAEIASLTARISAILDAGDDHEGARRLRAVLEQLDVDLDEAHLGGDLEALAKLPDRLSPVARRVDELIGDDDRQR